jgi:hypothetical protein
MDEFWIYIANFTVGISIFLAFICIYVYKKLDKLFTPFLIYLIAAGSFELVTSAYATVQANNLMYIHLFTLLEFVLLSIFFDNIFKYLQAKFNNRKITYIISIFVVLNSLFIQGLDSYNSISSTICSIVILSYCIYTFLLLIDYLAIRIYALVKWIVIGLFIYHTISLTILAFGNVIVSISSDYKQIIWIFRVLIILFTKALFCYVLLKKIIEFNVKTNIEGDLSRKNESNQKLLDARA